MKNTNTSFNRNEINLISDALNGCGMLIDSAHPSIWESPYLAKPVEGFPSALHHEIHDAIGLNGLDEKWNVNAEEILAKINSLSHRELCRIVLTIAAAWDKCNNHKAWDTMLDSLTF